MKILLLTLLCFGACALTGRASYYESWQVEGRVLEVLEQPEGKPDQAALKIRITNCTWKAGHARARCKQDQEVDIALRYKPEQAPGGFEKDMLLNIHYEYSNGLAPTGEVVESQVWKLASVKKIDEYISLFDGKTLAGWKSTNMRYWSVRDGAITAESTEDNPCHKNDFLIWQDGEVAHFEMKLKFRLSKPGNSGVQFRSRVDARGTMIGYQADMLPGGGWLGALCDENSGRKTMLAANGQRTVIDADGKRSSSRLGDPVTLKPGGEWNDYHIRAHGHHIVLTVNGRKSVEVHDNETGHFDPRGLVALQLRSGPFMKVQFKDIQLKHLP